MAFPFPCVILSGGQSSRMGKNKALLPFAGYDSLMEYQYSRLLPFFSTTCLSCKDTALVPFHAQVICDSDPTHAPMLAILSAFKSLKTEYLFVIPVDSPFVDSRTIYQMVECLDDEVDAVICSSPQGDHNLIGIFKESVIPVISQMHEKNSYCMGKLLDRIKTRKALFEEDSPFFNINHPKEYEEALRRTGTMS